MIEPGADPSPAAFESYLSVSGARVDSKLFQVDESHMQAMDRVLQNWRIRQAGRFIRDGDKLLDVGCFDGCLLQRYRPKLKRAAGLDPLVVPFQSEEFEIYADVLPGKVRFEDESFTCITMLAVLEHVEDIGELVRECSRILAPGGRVILTVPHPLVDEILEWLIRLKIVGGMSLEEHHHFDVRETAPAFEKEGFETSVSSSFQLGLNRLFVFGKPAK